MTSILTADYFTDIVNNREKVNNYFNGNTAEYMNETDITVGGMTLAMGLFIPILIIMLVIYIWAIYVLVKYWKQLPVWAQIIGVLGVIPGVPLSPIATLIVVYIGKSMKKNLQRKILRIVWEIKQ